MKLVLATDIGTPLYQLDCIEGYDLETHDGRQQLIEDVDNGIRDAAQRGAVPEREMPDALEAERW